MKGIIKLTICLSLICATLAWDSEELEIFDLVEEVKKNFYEFMGINQNATGTEIKRAFRGLSIVLHPDKNPSDDANIQFRNLVSIYEVLKDSGKREKYDKVLRDGLPNWKSALYYYRRMRKIGLYEGALILFIIITIGQYIFAWAAYLEKKYTAEQVLGSKLKKLQKKDRNIDMRTILDEIPKPSIKNTLPFQIPVTIWNLPKTFKEAFNKANELKELALERRRLELEEAKRQEELQKEFEEQARLRKENKENLRKRKQNSRAPEKTDEELRGYSQIQARELTEDDAVKPVSQKNTTLSGGFWTDEDLTELIRLVKKYPGGSSSRWDTIADQMNRTVQEVTFMAAKMKENGYRLPGQSSSVAENIIQDTEAIQRKIKTKKTNANSINILVNSWTQEQQKALEAAILKYRQNSSSDRWQKIANSVPGKTKEECLLRSKQLCEIVKSQSKNNITENKSTESVISDKETAPSVQKSKNEEKENVALNSQKIESTLVEEPSTDFVDKDKEEKKLSKREMRRRRKEMYDDEDSDDLY